LILPDNTRPVKDGIEVPKKIKTHNILQYIPVIMQAKTGAKGKSKNAATHYSNNLIEHQDANTYC
jgi:CheY-like chemotaxis protein